MTEQEWLTCADPNKLTAHVRRIASGRRLRLLAAAAVQQVESLLSSPLCQRASQLALRLADENVPEEKREGLRRELWEYMRINAGTRPSSTNADAAAAKAIHPLPGDAAGMAVWEVVKALARQKSGKEPWEDALCWAKERMIPVVRDIFGNPFRAVTFDSKWATPTVSAVAEGIYTALAFERLPVLADALEEGGCAKVRILSHFRKPGVHTRGCWALDLVLGKK